jgi:hypothetical protein
MPEKPDATLRKWWGADRDRALKALAMVLGIDRAELHRRLNVTSVAELAFPRPRAFEGPPPERRRPRGRPKRTMDPFEVAKAMKRHGGNIRAAARALGLPRTTLGRFVADVVSHLPELEAIAHREMRNARGIVKDEQLWRALPSTLRVGALPVAHRKVVHAIIDREYARRRARTVKPAKVIPFPPAQK